MTLLFTSKKIKRTGLTVRFIGHSIKFFVLTNQLSIMGNRM